MQIFLNFDTDVQKIIFWFLSGFVWNESTSFGLSLNPSRSLLLGIPEAAWEVFTLNFLTRYEVETYTRNTT